VVVGGVMKYFVIYWLSGFLKILELDCSNEHDYSALLQLLKENPSVKIETVIKGDSIPEEEYLK
jgi:hypothetical protein